MSEHFEMFTGIKPGVPLYGELRNEAIAQYVK